MSDSSEEKAWICRNGHLNHRDTFSRRCWCGADEFTACSRCGESPRGFYEMNRASAALRLPFYCAVCGFPYPWSTRSTEMLFLLRVSSFVVVMWHATKVLITTGGYVLGTLFLLSLLGILLAFGFMFVRGLLGRGTADEFVMGGLMLLIVAISAFLYLISRGHA